MTIHEKMTIPDLQKYPCSLNLIKILDDTKCLILIMRNALRNAKLTLAEKPQMKINSLKKEKKGFHT